MNRHLRGVRVWGTHRDFHNTLFLHHHQLTAMRYLSATNSTRMATILYFGWARDCAGADSDQLNFDEPLSQQEFWSQLLRLRPGLLSCQGASRIAVNQRYVGNHEPIEPHSEIAIIPPVAGG